MQYRHSEHHAYICNAFSSGGVLFKDTAKEEAPNETWTNWSNSYANQMYLCLLSTRLKVTTKLLRVGTSTGVTSAMVFSPGKVLDLCARDMVASTLERKS